MDMTNRSNKIEDSSVINIAVIGGSSYCKELLEKTTMDYRETDVNARMSAVADPDPTSPGVMTANRLGLVTVPDYHELYDPKYNIHLFIVLIPDQRILEDILETKPSHIRVQSYHVFNIFWKAISVEERKLRARTEEMETILNGIQDLICVITPDMIITEVNEAFTNHMGYSREELIGKKCHELFQNINSPCNTDEHPCPLNEVIKNKTHVRQVMKRIRNGNESRYYEVHIFPIWEKGGRVSEFIEISRDITVRLKEEEEITKRLEQMVEERTRQLQETHNKLLHQDKMASLGKLSASVVHEINNPIAGVLNLTMLIKKIIHDGPVNSEDMDKFKQYLDLMETETRRTSKIVSNLLTFSRQSKMELGRISVNQLIEQTLILNLNLLKINGIRVQNDLDPNLPEIIGSRDQLQQVFMNCISNAVEAMETTKNRILAIETELVLRNNTIRIAFIDTGVGIPRENMPKLFEPFFTTKKGKGVGLGLSVAYGIIEDHGGSIEIRSQTGQGTTFRIELPIKKTDPELN